MDHVRNRKTPFLGTLFLVFNAFLRFYVGDYKRQQFADLGCGLLWKG